jgi:hypothetical protein
MNSLLYHNMWKNSLDLWQLLRSFWVEFFVRHLFLIPIRLWDYHHYWISSFWSKYSTASELILNFDRLIVSIGYINNKISAYIKLLSWRVFYPINSATTKIHYVISPELIRISNPKNIIDAQIDPLSEVMYTHATDSVFCIW